MKKFEFSHHALERIKERSTSKEEVIQAITESEWFRAEKDRYSCSKKFAYNNTHYGKFYKWKDVVPVFVEEESSIFVITVYSYFSSKEVS